MRQKDCEVKLSSEGLSKVDSEIILKSLNKSGLLNDEQQKVLSDETVKAELYEQVLDEKKKHLFAAIAQVSMFSGKKLSLQEPSRDRYEEHDIENQRISVEAVDKSQSSEQETDSIPT